MSIIYSDNEYNIVIGNNIKLKKLDRKEYI